VLQHGSILVDDDQARIPALMLAPTRRIPPPATLRAILGRAPSASEVHEALAEAVLRMQGAAPKPLELDPDTRAIADRLADHYRDPAWTWRR
jgi:hypothetical protein